MSNTGDHKISRAPMTVHCGSCGSERSYHPQSIRHMQLTPKCAECGWRGWLDILGTPVFFGAPAKTVRENSNE